ncbi:MAG TPA: aldo/keto reductase [bacterium]|nr:aldo/keto reductase [bacterium]
MKKRVFGKSGMEVSEVGVGTWQFGGDWGQVSEDAALQTLKAAVDSGVNFFDTADVYGAGRSESIIGKFLKQSKAKVFVATKLIRFPDPGWPANVSWEAFRLHTENSIKRLGLEALDLTQLHCPTLSIFKKGEVFEWLRRLKKEGKIRNWGASVETVEEGLFCLQQEGLASLQVIFNLFRQKPLEALFPEAKKKGVAIIVRLSLASGLLAGKYRKDTQFAPEDHRTYNRDGEAFNVGETFAGLPFEKGVELADKLKPLLPAGMSLAQMANRWCLDFDSVTTIIPGAKNPQQAMENAKVSDFPPLSKELHQRLRDFYAKEVASHIRGGY